MLLKISPTTFCINTNQISPRNLLHLISLSTSLALLSHPQLKLPYWQMHIHKQLSPPFHPPWILHCSKPTYDDSSGRAVSILLALQVVNGSEWEAGDLLLPGFTELLVRDSQAAHDPVSGGFPVKPWHVSAQLHCNGWMFYPWLALMLSSSYCFKAAWCNIKAAAQTKHIQAGSWGGKREN